jgi:hypothetical protein
MDTEFRWGKLKLRDQLEDQGEDGRIIFFSMARQPYMGLGLLVSSRFHDHTQ